MAKFLYKMQSILDVKSKLESQAKIEYSIANNRLLEEEEKLKHFQNKKLGYERQYRLKMQDTLDLQEISLLLQGIDIMKKTIKQQALEVIVARRNLEAARVKLQREMQERKTHEKLKEHAFEDFLADLNMAENKEIDELVSYQYGRTGE